MSARPIAFVDKVGNVSTHDHSRLQKLLAELPDAPVGEPILALYDAATISQLQAEIARYREALTEIAEGFGPNHMSRYCQRVAKDALGGSNDKG